MLRVMANGELLGEITTNQNLTVEEAIDLIGAEAVEDENEGDHYKVGDTEFWYEDVTLDSVADKPIKAEEGTMELIRGSLDGLAVVELDGKYYCVEFCGYEVRSVGKDSPDNGRWNAKATESGVKYVACGLSRAAALARYSKAVEETYGC